MRNFDCPQLANYSPRLDRTRAIAYNLVPAMLILAASRALTLLVPFRQDVGFVGVDPEKRFLGFLALRNVFLYSGLFLSARFKWRWRVPGRAVTWT